MVHSVEELVLVDEAAQDEIYQTEEEDKPGRWQCAVHNANDED